MSYLQIFSGRFARGAFGLLGVGVLCLYVLGVVLLTVPVEDPVLAPAAGTAFQRSQGPTVSARTKPTSAKPVPMVPELARPPARASTVMPRGAPESAGVTLRVASADDLDRKLTALDYRLDDIREGSAFVPRLRLGSLPPDLARLESIKQRKRLFIKSMLPLILQANERILGDRRKLLRLLNAQDPLSRQDRAWVAALANRYDADPLNPSDLVGRVDVVPPSLAIAQAAEESGWGTSRFAVEGNAVFGQWTFRKGSGVVPERRDAGKHHEVRSFEELRQSVSAYMHNLNIHWAYEEFRRVRRELRSSNRVLTGERLIGALHKYSERGSKYIETIRAIMRVNGLGAFDRARLQDLDRARLGT